MPGHFFDTCDDFWCIHEGRKSDYARSAKGGTGNSRSKKLSIFLLRGDSNRMNSSQRRAPRRRKELSSRIRSREASRRRKSAARTLLQWQNKRAFAVWLQRITEGLATISPTVEFSGTRAEKDAVQRPEPAALKVVVGGTETTSSGHHGTGVRRRVPAVETVPSTTAEAHAEEILQYPVESLYSGCGLVGRKGQVYASTKRNPTLRCSTDWALVKPLIEEEGLGVGFSNRSFVLPTSFIEFKGRPVRPGKAQELRIPPAPGSSRTERAANIRQRLTAYLLDSRNAGVKVNIAPGKARPSCPELKPYLMESEKQNFVGSKTHSCAEASLLNGIYALCGYEDALEIAWAIESSGEEAIVMHLQKLGFLLQDYGGGTHRCELRKVKQYQKAKEKGMDGFEWLLNHSEGVYIVRMVGTEGLHHIVCVDSRSDKRIIRDNEENYPIRLSTTSLRLCGYPEKDPSIAEIRQLVQKKN